MFYNVRSLVGQFNSSRGRAVTNVSPNNSFQYALGLVSMCDGNLDIVSRWYESFEDAEHLMSEDVPLEGHYYLIVKKLRNDM